MYTVYTMLVYMMLFLCYVQHVHGYCSSIGANPSFTGPPSVVQINYTTVLVSWEGLVLRGDCTDQYIVKSALVSTPDDYYLSAKLSPNTFSEIVPHRLPEFEYYYEVIAREDKKWRGVDYNRSPHKRFTTSRKKGNLRPDIIHRYSSLSTEPSLKTEALSEAEMLDLATLPVSPEDRLKNTPKFTNEYLVWVIIGVLVIILLIAGAIYNFVYKKKRAKPLDFDTADGADMMDGGGDSIQLSRAASRGRASAAVAVAAASSPAKSHSGSLQIIQEEDSEYSGSIDSRNIPYIDSKSVSDTESLHQLIANDGQEVKQVDERMQGKANLEVGHVETRSSRLTLSSIGSNDRAESLVNLLADIQTEEHNGKDANTNNGNSVTDKGVIATYKKLKHNMNKDDDIIEDKHNKSTPRSEDEFKVVRDLDVESTADGKLPDTNDIKDEHKSVNLSPPNRIREDTSVTRIGKTLRSLRGDEDGDSADEAIEDQNNDSEIEESKDKESENIRTEIEIKIKNNGQVKESEGGTLHIIK